MTNQWTDQQMDGQTDGWMDRLTEGWSDGPKSGLQRCMNDIKHSETLKISFNWVKHPLNNFVTERRMD